MIRGRLGRVVLARATGACPGTAICGVVTSESLLTKHGGPQAASAKERRARPDNRTRRPEDGRSLLSIDRDVAHTSLLRSPRIEGRIDRRVHFGVGDGLIGNRESSLAVIGAKKKNVRISDEYLGTG